MTSPDVELRSPRRLVVAVDGSCLGNPGPGGWAWYQSQDCWSAGASQRTTNNAMELTAVRELLAAVDPAVPLLIEADSQYVINVVTKWASGWRRRGWRTASGSKIANQELVVDIVELAAGRDLRWQWVRAHAGHGRNESADRKARGAALCVRARTPVRTGPGMTADLTAWVGG